MRMSGVLAALVGLVAGTAAAVSAFHATSVVPAHPVAAQHRAAAVVGRPLPAPPPRVVVTTAPCKPPAKPAHGACVTTVVRTVVVHDLPPAPAPAASTGASVAPARAGAALGGEDRHEDPGHEAEPPDRGDD